MKRLRIVNKKKFIRSITILLLVIMSFLNLINGKSSANVIETEEYVVSSGDTLWSIASQYCDDSTDIREWIYNVRQLNNIDCNLQVGQTLVVIK